MTDAYYQCQYCNEKHYFYWVRNPTPLPHQVETLGCFCPKRGLLLERSLDRKLLFNVAEVYRSKK